MAPESLDGGPSYGFCSVTSVRLSNRRTFDPPYNKSVGTSVRSFCKINLGLLVGPTRADGFHGLTTCYQTIGLHDVVTISARLARANHIVLKTNHSAVPCTARGDCDRNTAYKIVDGMLQRLGVRAAVEIHIEKRLPVQGGLGAGSANAAAALLALERELDQALPGPERLALAAEVGSDVPLFLLGGTVLGLNRGEAVYPLPDSPALPVVVAVPRVGVSTGQAFRDLDAQMESTRSAQGLTAHDPPARLEQLSRVLASLWTPTGAGRVTTGVARNIDGDLADDPGSSSSSELGVLNPLLALARTGVENDFESVAFRQHPSLRDIKQALRGETGSPEPAATQALYAALSGSGSALFGIYRSAEAAHEAQQRVQALGTEAFVTETLTRPEYWQRMFA